MAAKTRQIGSDNSSFIYTIDACQRQRSQIGLQNPTADKDKAQLELLVAGVSSE
jgi:hypothetical protein